METSRPPFIKMETYMGRNMYNKHTSTVSSSVGRGSQQPAANERIKLKFWNHNRLQITIRASVTVQLCFLSSQWTPQQLWSEHQFVPQDPPPAARLLIKGISGKNDAFYCYGRYKAYCYWTKGFTSYQLSSGTRYYHTNLVYTQISKRDHRVGT